MTIKVTQGDLLEEQTDAIVNTVNCVGVMGKGIAYQFKRKWPANFKAYAKACKVGDVKIGKMFVYELGLLAGKPYYIINFPTKQHWKSKSELAYIEAGLKDLAEFIRIHEIKSIAIPPLGCGNGGLNWSEVKELIEKYLGVFADNLEVRIYEPKKALSLQINVTPLAKHELTVGRAILIKLLSIYKSLGDSLTKIEIQKLCYFAQEAGEDLKLRFVKNQFGPYADNLRHVLNALDGHYITGVGDNDTVNTNISITPNAVCEAENFLNDYPESQMRLNRVADVIEGFESPYGMELLATVLWVIKHDVAAIEPQTIINAVHNWEPSKPEWNKRKQVLMKDTHIIIALKRLKEKSWV